MNCGRSIDSISLRIGIGSAAEAAKQQRRRRPQATLYCSFSPHRYPTPTAQWFHLDILSATIFWGGMDGDISNMKKWIILCPVYINSKKTIAEGRRISTSKACEYPTCAEIGDCCSHLKLPFAIEIDKAYPRDFMLRGRVRVLLKREEGTLYNPTISSRKQLMLHVAELVPRHPGRTKKQDPTASASIVGPTKSGKGGRKKR